MKKLLLMAAMGVVFVPTVSVFAQETSQTVSFDPVARCEAMVERSQERYDANETRHADNSARLNGSIDKLEEFIEKADSFGVDTSALENDIQALKGYQDEINVDHQAVQDDLMSMAQADCETMTAEDYQNQIAQVKSLFKAFKEDVESIRELRTTIKTHVDEMLSEIKSIVDSGSAS